jgi:hypothetical protein
MKTLLYLSLRDLGKCCLWDLVNSCYFVYRLCMGRGKTRNNKHRQVPNVNNNTIRTTCFYRRSLLGFYPCQYTNLSFPLPLYVFCTPVIKRFEYRSLLLMRCMRVTQDSGFVSVLIKYVSSRLLVLVSCTQIVLRKNWQPRKPPSDVRLNYLVSSSLLLLLENVYLLFILTATYFSITIGYIHFKKRSKPMKSMRNQCRINADSNTKESGVLIRFSSG